MESNDTGGAGGKAGSTGEAGGKGGSSGGEAEGGSAGDGSVEADGDRGVSGNKTQPCIEEATPLEENEAAALGFSAADVLAFVEGVHEAELIWRDGTKTAFTFTVTAISASYVSSVGNPEFVSDYETVYCEDHIVLEVSSTLVTDDGQFNETWESHAFKSILKDGARTVLTKGRGEIVGTYSPGTSSDQCFLSLQFNITLSPDFFSGSIGQVVVEAACDASFQPLTAVAMEPAGSWNSFTE